MSEMVWIRHPATEAVVEVPKEALPMYRQSGWNTVPKKDLAEREKTLADEIAAAEADMEEKARQARGEAPPAPPADDAATQGASLAEPGVSLADEPSSDAAGRQTEKGNA